jgi:hypothetical protein
VVFCLLRRGKGGASEVCLFLAQKKREEEEDPRKTIKKRLVLCEKGEISSLAQTSDSEP